MTNKDSRTARRQRQNQKQRKVKKPLFKRILLLILLLILVVGVGIAGLFTYYIVKSPALDPEKLSDPFASEIFDMNDF